MTTSSLLTGRSLGRFSIADVIQDKPWGNWSPAPAKPPLPFLPPLALPKTYTVIFDFSIYQSDYGYIGCTYNSQVNWMGLKNNGVQFVIFRVGGPGWTDASFAKHVTAAKAAGIICGFYYWVDPIRSPKTNANGLKAHVDTWKPFFIAADIEQPWADWNDFDAYLAGRITWDAIKKLTPAQVGNTVTAVFDYMKTLKNIKSVAYSGWWYGSPDGLYPEVGDLITKYDVDYWNAHYLLKPVPPAREIFVSQVSDLFPRIPAWNTQLGAVDSSKTSLLQISSQIRVTGPNPGDGQSGKYDMNILRPGLSLYEWLGLELGPDDPINIYVPIVFK